VSNTYASASLATTAALSSAALKPAKAVASSAGTLCDSKIDIQMEYGLPHLTVTLPSRHEQCVFVLRPVTHTVGDLIDMLQQEDAGIDRVVIKNHKGVRIAATTIIQHLLEEPCFELVINDRTFVADAVTLDKLRPSLTVQGMTGLPTDELQQVNDVKSFIGRLYESLHIAEHQRAIEAKVIGELEAIQDALEPLEKERQKIAIKAERSKDMILYCNYFFHCATAGFLARLTWWEYSWDIMEPVTYFVGAGYGLAGLFYFMIRGQEYQLLGVSTSLFLRAFYRHAKRTSFDVETFNALIQEKCKTEEALKALRDPHRLMLPKADTVAYQKKAEEGKLKLLSMIQEKIMGKSATSTLSRFRSSAASAS